MSYINTQATSSYKEALQALENFEAPALGFCKTAAEGGNLTISKIAVKQNNTQIQLLVAIKEQLNNIEERLQKLEAQPERREAVLPEAVINNLNDRIRALKISEKQPEKSGKLLVFNNPYTLFEQEKQKARK